MNYYVLVLYRYLALATSIRMLRPRCVMASSMMPDFLILFAVDMLTPKIRAMPPIPYSVPCISSLAMAFVMVSAISVFSCPTVRSINRVSLPMMSLVTLSILNVIILLVILGDVESGNHHARRTEVYGQRDCHPQRAIA